LIPLKFLDDVMALKRVPRSGWITYRISKYDVEPVSSHSYSVAVIALVMSETVRLTKGGLDVEKVLEMALLHDLSESMTFDISKAYLRYLGRRGEKVKRHLEQKAISRILAGVNNRRLAKTLRITVEEYDSAKSLEAKIVHCADAIDLLLQVIEYEKMGYSKTTLNPIWKATRAKLTKYKFPLADQWSRQLEKVRTGLHSKRAYEKSRVATVR
jgi:5'-deoxynucleotidase YfbR-like HD superfamily hydrolase